MYAGARRDVAKGATLVNTFEPSNCFTHSCLRKLYTPTVKLL
jgi:hypothetical protein